ncbi:metallophosphoesterase [Weissella sp. MSCH1]|uniref:metallophosphoesterase n=1 Tax=Weissella sp. MSCH1 TaxID=3383343 RepID=UPI003896C26A
MVKIAVTSDNHLDINKQEPAEILAKQTQKILEMNVNYYLIAGDLFNDFKKSMAYVSDLQENLGDQTKVLFIAGNHDMGRGTDFAELESPVNDFYLHNKYVDIPGTDWRIIGHNGWYDYLFARGIDPADVAAFRRGFYYDRIIEQPMTDPERMDLGLAQMKVLLDDAQAAGKQVIFMTHFAPIGDELIFPIGDRRWATVNGVLGSPRTGELLESYDNVRHVFYGHIHVTVPPREKNGVIYYNPSVGYNRRRLQEWTADNFFDAWQNKVQEIVLTSK